MKNSINAREDLVIEEFWLVRKPSWVDYFVVCSGRILSLNEHGKVLQVRSLPKNAEPIVFAESNDAQADASPTRAMCAKIAFIGSEFGDDITILLTNGGAVIRFLNHDPTSGRSMPEIMFLGEQRLRDRTEPYRRENMTPLTVELLD